MSDRPMIRVMGTTSLAALALTLSAAVSYAALEIRHNPNDEYDVELTRAYVPCAAPNDTSSDGVPACSPPVTSACSYSSGDLQVDKIKNAPKLNMNLKINNVSGPGSCTSGPYAAEFKLRITADDTGCTGGQCTWEGDVSFSVPLTLDDGDLELDDVALEDVALGYGIYMGHVASYQILGLTIFAPDNKPMAAAGMGNQSAKSFTSNVGVPYPECTAPDTSTVVGFPACSNPTWGGSCDFIRGEIRARDNSSNANPDVPEVTAIFSGLIGTSPLCADGTYIVAMTVRATGSVCSGAPCTLIDTEALIPVTAEDGVINDDGWDASLAGPFDTMEVLETRFLDPFSDVLATNALSNAFLVAEPVARIKFRDLANPNDDLIVLKGGFPHPAIDPSVGGATFTATDRNGTIYTATIPAGSWQVVKPGAKWQYKDPLGTNAGVVKASIREFKSSGIPSGFRIKLKAKNVDLSAADLPTVNVVFSISNNPPGASSIGMRNAPCTVRTKGLTCHL